MPNWDDFVAPCPNCEGDGCEICDGGGQIVVPSKIEQYLTKMRHELFQMRETRHTMMDTYRRWLIADEPRAARIMRLMVEAGIYEELTNDPKGRRVFDLRMTKDILDMEDRLDQGRRVVAAGEHVTQSARDLWRRARKAAKQRHAAPPPPPTPPRQEKKRTKASGKICRFPKCPKDAKVWDEKGQGWCRRHAYERGLLARPKIEEEEE